MNTFRSYWKWGLLVAVLLFITLFPLADRPTYVDLLALIAFYSIGAACFRMMLLLGRFSLGQSFFVAAGAYTSGILSVKVGLSPWLGLLLAGVVAAILAYAIGLVILRVPGMYFAIITMALGILTVNLLNIFQEQTGGVNGLLRIPPYQIGSYSFGMRVIPYYYLFFALAITSLFIMWRLEKSPLGLVMHAVGENDSLSMHMGVNIAQHRLLIFVLTGVLTAFSGAVYAHYLHYVNPGQVGLTLAMYYQIYAIAGGLASIWGSVLGVVFVEFINRFAGVAIYVQPIIYGGILVTVFMVLPRGLVSLPDRVKELWNRRSRVAKKELAEAAPSS